jgi:hypothetical protein
MALCTEEELRFCEALYRERVSHPMAQWQKSYQLLPTDDGMAALRQELSYAFWNDWRARCFPDEATIRALQKRMLKRRQSKRMLTLRDMGFDPVTGEIRVRRRIFYKTYRLLRGKREAWEKQQCGRDFLLRGMHYRICHRLPYVTKGTCSVATAERLSQVCAKILRYMQVHRKKPSRDGFSLANVVVEGGAFSCREKGILGSVHWSDFFDDDVALGYEFFATLRQVFRSAFRDCGWFPFLNAHIRSPEHDNWEYLSDRLLPGTCITNVRLIVQPSEYHAHCDDRHFGVGLLCVPEDFCGGELMVSNPEFDVVQPIPLKKRDVIAGCCFQSRHYHQPVFGKTPHLSILSYFDSRLGSKRYIRQDPVRFRANVL